MPEKNKWWLNVIIFLILGLWDGREPKSPDASLPIVKDKACKPSTPPRRSGPPPLQVLAKGSGLEHRGKPLLVGVAEKRHSVPSFLPGPGTEHHRPTSAPILHWTCAGGWCRQCHVQEGRQRPSPQESSATDKTWEWQAGTVWNPEQNGATTGSLAHIDPSPAYVGWSRMSSWIASVRFNCSTKPSY